MVKILWVDDEVELLKPHVLFLKQKGYEVDTCNNGYDAIDMASEGAYDLIILDEMMPGMTGLETLPKIKEVRPTTPVIMVTKSEEENIMDKAVGSKIADYLIKPVNPNQVLLSIKKNVHQQQLVTEQTTADYRSEFGRISSSLQMAETFGDWCSLYRKLANWEVDLSESTDQSIQGGADLPENRGQIRSSASSCAATTTTGSTGVRKTLPDVAHADAHQHLPGWLTRIRRPRCC